MKVKGEQDGQTIQMIQAALKKRLEPEKYGYQEEGKLSHEQYQACKDLVNALQRDHDQLVATIQNQRLKLDVMEIETDMQPEYFKRLTTAVMGFFNEPNDAPFTFRK